MTQPRIVHFDSLDALRAAAVQWDDLWRRSDATLPALRAELLAQWVEHFASSTRFHAVAVEEDDRLVAALPMVQRKVGRLLHAGAMPCNEWSSSGDLLLDVEPASLRALGVLDALATGIREIGWPLLWLDEAVLNAPRWQQLQQVFARRKMTIAEHPRCQVGRVQIDHDWPAYKSRWSRKHRQKMAQALRRLAAEGDVRLVVHGRLVPAEVAAVLRQCLQIEDRSWKGAAGTSILQTAGMAEFYIGQAEQAARWGQLEIAMLYCGDRAAAFSYGLSAKGVFHSMKVGYDPAFATHHAGQLLRYSLLEHLFADPQRRAVDFQGPMTEAHAAWLPETYTIGRLVIAPSSLLGRLAVRAYKDIWPLAAVCARRGKGEGRKAKLKV